MHRRRVLAGAGAALGTVPGCTTVRQLLPTPPADWESTVIATWRGDDPATSITLQWLNDSSRGPANVTVRLRDASGTGTTETTRASRFGSTSYHRIRAELGGLDPDTSYAIEIDGTATGLTVRTAPAAVSAPITFAAGGDIGTGAVVPQLHGQAASWDPLFGLVGGDLAYADADPAKVGRWITWLEQWHDQMRSGDRLIPIVAAIGNHEVEGGMHGTPGDAAFFYNLFDNTRRDHAYWAMDIGDSLSIVILDSNHTTEIPGPQTDWLEDALATRRHRDHLLVAYHVPAYPSAKPISGAGRDRGEVREHWVPRFERYAIDLAFEHDDHAYKRTHPLQGGSRDPTAGIRYVGDGAWGMGPREVVDRPYLAVSESALHVIRAQIFPDGRRQFRAVNPNGTVIDAFNGASSDLG